MKVKTKAADKSYTDFDKIEIEVRTHAGFTEFEIAKKKAINISRFFGRHQFLYRRNGNEISLIETKAFEGRWCWEIYCIKGKLFEDTQRFPSKQEADDYIIALLTPEEQI
ncbi:MAG: hypothetical protein KAR35_06115 [Candidatus Heimdallarchaeota archaeon]|nr:hypothetical protein [Candidatus Heimdallarchaeota archaeon]MCK5048934.1 hypothetical protein [Candidatus Heimdallarchaeota archaeon]